MGVMKHLVSVSDASKEEFDELLELSENIKKKPRDYYHAMERKTLVMLFEKKSTRTRLSFEIAMTQMGGHAIYFNPTDTQFKKEDIQDTAKMFSCYADILCGRVFSHNTLTEIAKHSSIPVINALSDIEHPTQALSDMLTIKEHKGLKGVKAAFVGDGNNVCNSLILACAYAGVELLVACPRGYEPNGEIVKKARGAGGKITVTNDPKDAVSDADAVYTDVWVSMGQEDDGKKKMDAFRKYKVTKDLMKLGNDAIFMHCLPAIRGCEVDADVIDGQSSVVYGQAENKLYAQKAAIVKLGNIVKDIKDII